jgi:hypothetical protein
MDEEHMNIQSHSQTILGEPSPLTGSPFKNPSWYVVRAGLLMTLVSLLMVLGFVTVWPAVVDHSLAVVLAVVL